MPEALPHIDVQPVSHVDVEAAVETITVAFQGDPVWKVALEAPGGATGHLRPFWRLYVEGARRYDTVYTSTGAKTVSVWIPPGGEELSEEQEAAMHELARSALGPDRARALVDLVDRFEANHPRSQPHAYLGLLATHPSSAGHGFGQAHLAADLGRWDDAGLSTYLESTNPRNNHRYARLGYKSVGHFETPFDGATVTTM